MSYVPKSYSRMSRLLNSRETARTSNVGDNSMSWPHTIPADLRRRLESVMGFRSFGPTDVWAELCDWMIEHGVPAPEKLPVGTPSGDPLGDFTYFIFDNTYLAAISGDGIGFVELGNGVWSPKGGARTTAIEMIRDERVPQLTPMQAMEELAARGLKPPER